MIVLTCTKFFIPGYKGGGPIRALKHLAKHLEEDVFFKFITLNHDDGEEPYSNITSNQWNKLNGFNIFYINKKKRALNNLYNLIRNENYNVLYLNSFFDPFFTIIPLFIFVFFRKNKNNKLILAPRGEFSPGALSIKSFKKRAYITIFKALKLHKRVIWHASFAEDKNHIIEQMGEEIDVHIAADLPQKINDHKLSVLRPNKFAGEILIIFVSRISRKKNLEYALKILKKIKGNVKFDIFGPKEDVRYWKTCENIIKTLPHNINVKYKGDLLPNDVIETFSKFHLFFFPTKGENFGYVILEALMGGCPVIISDQTPWKDFERKGIGADIPLESEEYFQTKLQEFVNMNSDEFQSYSNNAFEYSKEYCNNEKIIAQSRELFFQDYT
jgi:glycosyltransferase involved in cell wall biosynthesis